MSKELKTNIGEIEPSGNDLINKELEAWEEIKLGYICGQGAINEFALRESERQKLELVETALKEKEQQDSVLKVLKEIIEFAQTLPHIEPNKNNGFNIMSAVSINIQRDIENKERELLRQWVLKTCFPKELKALEIIKEKRVDIVGVLLYAFKREDGCDFYNSYMIKEEDKLTQEEYDLLKEVLFILWHSTEITEIKVKKKQLEETENTIKKLETIKGFKKKEKGER